MADIKISYQEVLNAARDVRRHNEKLSTTLADIKSLIQSMEREFVALASDNTRENMNAMQPIFDTYKEVIEKYAQFLEKAAASHENVDRTLASNADSQLRPRR